MKKKLAISREYYRNLLQSLPLGIITSDKDGYVTDLNQEMLELLNLNDLDIDAIKTAETTFLQRPTINKALSDCISDDRFIEIEDQIELSGSLLHLHIRIVPLHYPESEISSAFLIVENITSRKNSERELMISEERYRSLQNNVPVGVFRVF